MTTEKLKELGLNEEQVNGVMSLKGEYFKELEEKVEIAEKSLEETGSRLTEVTKERDEQLEKLQNTNPDELQNEINELKAKNLEQEQTFKAQLAETKKKNAIMLEIKDKVHDTGLMLSLIDLEKVGIVNDKLDGLEEQLVDLKENKPFLFVEDSPSGTGGSKGNTNKGSRSSVITQEDFDRMNYKEREEIYNTDRELFEELNGV